MRAVLKIGGSLLKHSDSLLDLLLTIEKFASKHQLLLIPGGGPFADDVLKAQQALGLSDDAAHWMAIMAQNQFGIVLADRLSSINVILDVDEFSKSVSAGLFVLMPFSYIRRNDELPHSWDVTSDSIALWIGEKVKSDFVLLVKSVDGLINPSDESQILTRVEADELHAIDKREVVDAYLPELVRKFSGRLLIVNGRHPERINHIFSGQETVYTEII